MTSYTHRVHAPMNHAASHENPNAWFSPVFMAMGLHSGALQATGAPLLNFSSMAQPIKFMINGKINFPVLRGTLKIQKR